MAEVIARESPSDVGGHLQKTSDLFVRCLEAERVEFVFGVPGEENADVLMSLAASSIEFVVCHHEQAAAFMADVHGRLTGRPGVCLATLGPGATNLLTGVASANLDHAPLVAITGQGATTRLHKESHQSMDVEALFRPVTKWGASVRHGSTVPELVRKAFKVAARQKPGATHLEIPEDIAKHEVVNVPISPAILARRPEPDRASVQEAISLIESAERPVVLVGHGAVRTRAAEAVRGFVEATGIHAAMTFMAKGVVSDACELSLFAAGLGSRDHVTEVFERADLVITIGYDFVEWHPSRWNRGRRKNLVVVDTQYTEIDDAYRPSIELVGDISASLRALVRAFDRQERFDVAEHRRTRKTMADEVVTEGADEAAFPIRPQAMLRTLRTKLDSDALLLCDVGAHKMWVARNFATYEPNTCLITNGFCSMGFALPGSIAGKLTFQDRQVVSLSGDGGFLMNVQELATAARLRLPTVNLVWEDGGYGLIEWKQELEFGQHFGTEFRNPDFVQLARSFGCFAERVTSAAHLGEVLDEALAIEDRPSVVVIPIDYSENLKLSARLGALPSN